MYARPNFKSKKQLREAVKNGEPVHFFQPGIGPPTPENGTIFVEGPHFPVPHSWYAEVKIEDGRPVRVK